MSATIYSIFNTRFSPKFPEITKQIIVIAFAKKEHQEAQKYCHSSPIQSIYKQKEN